MCELSNKIFSMLHNLEAALVKLEEAGMTDTTIYQSTKVCTEKWLKILNQYCDMFLHHCPGLSQETWNYIYVDALQPMATDVQNMAKSMDAVLTANNLG